MKHLSILRIKQDELIQTLGYGVVFDGIGKIFEFSTLELPWLQNRRNISCIPLGNYDVEKYLSPTKGRGEVFQFTNVPGRSNVQIHIGNYYTDILGCILVGAGFTDINKDGFMDIYSSKRTMNKLLELMPNFFQLTISEL